LISDDLGNLPEFDGALWTGLNAKPAGVAFVGANRKRLLAAMDENLEANEQRKLSALGAR